jgi:putative modified peptide
VATSEADIAAQLIERLLGDPAFRSEFRRDPAAACRKAGLDELADEMSIGAGKAMMTLDQRESKSSLAGVMMAAAMEGVGVYQFGEHILPAIGDVPSAVGDVLSRVSLPAVDLKGALAGGPDAPAAAPVDAGGANGAAEAGADAAGAGGGGGAAAAAEPVPADAAAAPEKAVAAADKAAGAKEAALPPEQAAAGKAAAKIAAAESPEAKRADEIGAAVEKIKEDAKDLPSASDLPESGVAPKPVEEVGPGAGDGPVQDHAAQAAPAAPAVPPEAAAAQPPAPAAAVEAAAGSGSGGGGAAEALLQNKNLVLDADAQKDLRDGAVDPRMVALLGKLSEKHKIELSVIKTGHAQFTSGGSVSNHFEGRGIDIARVDGEIVGPGSVAARDLAAEIADMTGDLRPTEVGTPWPIGESGFFTDGGHQDHLHVAFDGEPPAGFQAPPPPAAPGAAAPPGAPVASAAAAAPGQPAAAAAPGQPAAAAALAQPKGKAGDSLSFRAVTAEDAAKAAKGGGGDELSFMQPPAGPPSAIAAGAVPAVVADAATATSGGSSGLGAAALETAKGELAKGVHEEGVNTGAEVDQYLKAAGVGPGNPWCASFVTWSLAQNGHKMEGSGWAAVQTWVRNAEAGNNNLEVVSAEDARPGDIVAYDWGGQEDFGSDGHIGFVASNVENGKFAALEGNNQDRVMTVPRSTDQANVKFIRIKGDAPAGAAAPSAPVAPPVSGAPAPPAAVESGGGSAPPAAVEPSGGGGAADVASAAADAGSLKYPGDGAPKEQIAAWMAAQAKARGLPPQLPVMASLVESGMTNIQGGDADSVGFYQMRVGIWDSGPYAGFQHKPELQVKWFLDQAEAVKKARVAAGKPIDDPNSFGEWIADVERPAEQYRGRYQLRLGEANDLLGSAASAPPAAAAAAVPAPAAPGAVAAAVEPKAKPGDSLSFRAVTAEDAAKASAPKKGDELSFMKPPAGPASAIATGPAPPVVADAATATAGGSSGLGASALEVAKGELAKGVHEEGVNTGTEVDQYLKAAGVGPGNPWCASFVTWSLQQAGHKMDGSGWAAVQTWVRAAEAKTNNLEIVSAEDARPGDIVAYDWGGQEDFAADGHIGFLASNVQGDGKFTALEGNNQDAVMSVPRSTGQANVKFIRINGDAPAGAPAPTAPLAPPPSGAAAPPAAVEGFSAPGSAPAPPAAVETPGQPAVTPAPAAAAPPEAAAAAAPGQPAAAAGSAAGPPEAHAAEAAGGGKAGDELKFMAAKAEDAAERKRRATVQFMKAIDPKSVGAPAAAAASAAPPEAVAAASATPGGPLAPTAADDAAANQAVGAPVPEGELALQNVGPIGTYPGDNASQAQLAQWLAAEAKKAGLPPELPVMASLVESGVQNVKGGDADSAGFFQMRVGIWDNGPYKGFRMNPNLQAKWFIDNALAVKRARLAAGKSVTDPGSFGEWIADVERPAAQYRYKYQLRLTEARKLISGR